MPGRGSRSDNNTGRSSQSMGGERQGSAGRRQSFGGAQGGMGMGNGSHNEPRREESFRSEPRKEESFRSEPRREEHRETGMSGFGMGHESVRKEPMGMNHEPVRREPMGMNHEPMRRESMGHEPFGMHHPEPEMHRRPRHTLPFGLLAAVDIIWNEMRLQRLRRILMNMTYDRAISPEDSQIIYESFGRYIDYSEAPELLTWVEREIREY